MSLQHPIPALYSNRQAAGARKEKERKRGKKTSVYECRVIPVLMRRQLRQARGSCPRVQKIMPDRRSMRSCVRVCVTSHSTFAKIDRSYLLLFSVSAVSGNFRSFWLFFALFQVGIFGSLCINRCLSKRILGIRLEPQFCPLFAI